MLGAFSIILSNMLLFLSSNIPSMSKQKSEIFRTPKNSKEHKIIKQFLFLSTQSCIIEKKMVEAFIKIQLFIML